MVKILNYLFIIDREDTQLNSYEHSTIPLDELINELSSSKDEINSLGLFNKIARWRWWDYEKLLSDPKIGEFSNILSESYSKFGRLEARELKKYNSAIRKSINHAKLKKDYGKDVILDEDLYMFLYVRRLYDYLSSLERYNFKDSLRVKQTKLICRKLIKWNVTRTFNLEFLIRLYCIISGLEGYIYLPILHKSIFERMKNMQNMVDFISNLDPKLAFKFINEFSRFEIFKGNYKVVLELLDIYFARVSSNLNYKPTESIKPDVEDLVKLYRKSFKSDLIFDDLAIYTELAINLARDIPDIDKSFEIVGNLFQILRVMDSNRMEVSNCALYSLIILLNNYFRRCTMGCNDVNDGVLLQDSIPIIELISGINLEELPISISSFITNTIVYGIHKMARDYETIDSPLVNKSELDEITRLFEVISRDNPNFSIIGRRLSMLYEFNLEIDKCIDLIKQNNFLVSQEKMDVLEKKKDLISRYGKISEIPLATSFPMIEVNLLNSPITYDIYNKYISNDISNECIWVSVREVISGRSGHGMLLNINENKIYGIWSSTGLSASGFFPSNNYSIMDDYNSKLDTIRIRGQGVWRLHPIVDLSRVNIDDINIEEYIRNVYEIVKNKCKGLFENFVMVNAVSIIINPEYKWNLDSINHKFNNIKTVKL